MNIILNHKHDAEISSQLDSANHLARTRIVDICDVYRAVVVLNNKFADCSKKSMEGLTVRVDINSQCFPKAYSGIPMSTHFVLVYEKRSWRFVCAERSRCGEFRKFEVEELPVLMREELLKRFESFDC
jgi:hypothetical protein